MVSFVTLAALVGLVMLIWDCIEVSRNDAANLVNAVFGSGLADRVFVRGSADLKVGRAIWVTTCGFIAPVIAIVATGFTELLAFHLSILGLILCIVLNLLARLIFKRRADAYERKYHPLTDKSASLSPSEA